MCKFLNIICSTQQHLKDVAVHPLSLNILSHNFHKVYNFVVALSTWHIIALNNQHSINNWLSYRCILKSIDACSVTHVFFISAMSHNIFTCWTQISNLCISAVPASIKTGFLLKMISMLTERAQYQGKAGFSIKFSKWHFSKYWQVQTRRVFAQTVIYMKFSKTVADRQCWIELGSRV